MMRAIHYINQFFGQIGGEDKADYPLEVREAVVGPGMAFKAALGNDVEIVATIICGDNYFNEHTEEVTERIKAILTQYSPDMLIAGPAFNAGRYGMACGGVCKIANESGITAISGMYPENPGVELYRKHGYFVATNNSAAGMKDAVAKMVALIKKLTIDPESVDPESDGYIRRGIRQNYRAEKTGAARSVDMLLNKIHGLPFKTELPMPSYKKVIPSPGIKDLSKARIAVLTTGGLVPPGNPDHIEACLASKYRKYSFNVFGGPETMKGEVCHGGYDPIYCNENGSRMIPADVLSEFEKEGVIGKLHEFTYVTSGNGMATKNALKFGSEIAQELLEANVSGAILTSA